MTSRTDYLSWAYTFGGIASKAENSDIQNCRVSGLIDSTGSGAGITETLGTDKTTMVTAAALQSNSFVALSLSGYVYKEGDYPILSWEATTDVWVNGQHFGNGMTTINCGSGKATYDVASDTLYLDNAAIPSSANCVQEWHSPLSA